MADATENSWRPDRRPATIMTMNDERWGPRIDVRDRIDVEQSALLDLLAALAPPDWARPTMCTGWTVHDVATHLLGGILGKLSRHRDGHQPDAPRPGEAFPAFIDRINDEWTTAARRLSPQVLCGLLASGSTELREHWRSVDLDRLGEPVTWAGPEPAPYWLDAAREYTEHWVHQQQIREAVGAAPLNGPWLRDPVLDTFLRALPYALRAVPAAEGTAARFRISDAEVSRTAERVDGRWASRIGPTGHPTAEVAVPADVAWRLLTGNVDAESVRDKISVTGDPTLCTAMLGMVSIIVS